MYSMIRLNVMNISQIKTLISYSVLVYTIFFLQHLLPNFMVGGIFLLDIHLTSISYIVYIIDKFSLKKVLRLPYNLGLELLLKPIIHTKSNNATTFYHHLKMVPKNIPRTSSIMCSKLVQKAHAISNKRTQMCS